MTLSYIPKMESDGVAADLASRAVDGRVQLEIEAILKKNAYREVRLLDCSFRNGEVVLNGTVSTFYLKQLAQTSLQNVPQVTRIVNLVKVHTQPDRSTRRAK